ncbi:MAG: hypothetical protein EOP32_40335, partial [Rhodococcus sp. (in: high G+C Gram-positive bacteria)]
HLAAGVGTSERRPLHDHPTGRSTVTAPPSACHRKLGNRVKWAAKRAHHQHHPQPTQPPKCTILVH